MARKTSRRLALRLRLAPGVRLSSPRGGPLVLAVPGERPAEIPIEDRAVRQAVARLRGGAAPDALGARIAAAGGLAALAEWYAALAALLALRGVRQELHRGAQVLGALAALGPHADEVLAVAPPPGRWRLSRFAALRATADGLVLESPRGAGRIESLRPEALAWLAALAAVPRRGTRRPRVPAPFLALLHAAGLLVRASTPPDDELPGWSVADANFHWRSRLGRHHEPYGASFPLADRQPPAPAFPPTPRGRAIALPRPDLGRLTSEDAPFTRVLESRRSRRDFGEAPLALAALGEFLYRAARVQSVVPPRRGPHGYAWTFRPSPSGGATHSLELYLAVRHCEGVAPGLYHYDPRGHRLHAIPRGAEHAAALLATARSAVPGTGAPSLLVVLASRFLRVQWKYESMAYATILKDAGALLQTMYLVATAMDLAPCAVGGGDADRLARAIGRGFFEETSVAEFLLGTKPAEGRRRGGAA